MKKIIMNTVFLGLIASLISCSKYNSPEINQGVSDIKPELYDNLYDPISNKGQYNLLEMTVKPKRYWNVVEVINVGSRNNIGEQEEVRGLQYHLLAQSIAGLTNRAVQQGRSEIGVWFEDHGGKEAYSLSKAELGNLGITEQGRQSAIEVARNNYGDSDGIKIQVKDLFDGYVLTDVVNNPESNIVASVASSVYNSIIVDIRDKSKYDDAGYAMRYDARTKSTADAWREFKDKVSKKALVVMPVQTGELRDFAITHNLFVLNINKINGSSSAGQNLAIFEEILSWLEPGAPIYGWEQGIDEDVFVNRASRKGHVWVPSDWMYNIPLTSLTYSSRQKSVLSKIINPQFIEYDNDKNYISYYLSDGDNVQWMMGDFVSEYLSNPDAVEMKMGFGFPASNVNQMAPAQFYNIMNKQHRNYTMIEALGGGYQYVDNFGFDDNRKTRLDEVAKRVGHTMRQHRVKILGLMAKDVKSTSAIEGYQAFVDANDQLEGIVVLQYSPYAGGKGEIFWIKNKQGFEIPVVSVRYSLWNFGTMNNEREGTPAYIANKLNNDSDKKFSIIGVHAWSKFKDTGNSTDLIGENSNGNLNGASAAKLMKKHLPTTFETIGVQEMIWRVRMHYKPEQTKEYLSKYF